MPNSPCGGSGAEAAVRSGSAAAARSGGSGTLASTGSAGAASASRLALSAALAVSGCGAGAAGDVAAADVLGAGVATRERVAGSSDMAGFQRNRGRFWRWRRRWRRRSLYLRDVCQTLDRASQIIELLFKGQCGQQLARGRRRAPAPAPTSA